MNPKTFVQLAPLRLCLGLFLLLFTLKAQGNEPPATLQIRAMLVGQGSARNIHLIGEEGFLPLRVSSVQPSQPAQVRAMNPFPIYDEVPESWNSEAPPEPAATVSLPPNQTHLLLLAFDDGAQTQYTAIPDDLHAATHRDWRFINTTNTAIAFQLGTDTAPLLLQPRSQQSHRITTTEQQGAAVTAAARIAGEPTTFYSTYWPIQANRRAMVLFIQQDEENIRVHRITEALVQEEEGN
ncbi:MAG: hypothetical protein JJU29_12330 [Verrucomicrobia bacterium]|nr:hypothetical protein [Verrucomicrobiota bacterium]MCH8510162.1 hypothetical protein [Kiritimatiellia bacterium]